MITMAKSNRGGLSTFALKMIALIFMTIDHIGYFCRDIAFVGAHYTAFRILGRIAAPIFLFTLVQGCMHTRSKPRYALRLYIAGVLTGLFHAAMNALLGGVIGIHSLGVIFFTFACTVLYITVVERFAAAVQEHRPLRALLFLGVGAAVFCLRYLRDPLCNALFGACGNLQLSADIADALFPMGLEYSWGFVILGVIMYFARDKRRQIAVFGLFCVLCFLGYCIFPLGYYYFPGFFTTSFALSFFNSVQIYQFLAIPLMLFYNGRRGRSMKYLFYVYYPLHMYVLIAINLIFGK